MKNAFKKLKKSIVGGTFSRGLSKRLVRVVKRGLLTAVALASLAGSVSAQSQERHSERNVTVTEHQASISADELSDFFKESVETLRRLTADMKYKEAFSLIENLKKVAFQSKDEKLISALDLTKSYIHLIELVIATDFERDKAYYFAGQKFVVRNDLRTTDLMRNLGELATITKDSNIKKMYLQKILELHILRQPSRVNVNTKGTSFIHIGDIKATVLLQNGVYKGYFEVGKEKYVLEYKL